MWPRKQKRQMPLVVVKRDEPVVWSRPDAGFMRNAINSESGKKAIKILEDSIATSLNGREEMGSAVIRAQGMTAMLDLLFRLAAKNRYTGQEEDLTTTEDDKGFEERTILQEDEE